MENYKWIILSVLNCKRIATWMQKSFIFHSHNGLTILFICHLESISLDWGDAFTASSLFSHSRLSVCALHYSTSSPFSCCLFCSLFRFWPFSVRRLLDYLCRCIGKTCLFSMQSRFLAGFCYFLRNWIDHIHIKQLVLLILSTTFVRARVSIYGFARYSLLHSFSRFR